MSEGCGSSGLIRKWEAMNAEAAEPPYERVPQSLAARAEPPGELREAIKETLHLYGIRGEGLGSLRPGAVADALLSGPLADVLAERDRLRADLDAATEDVRSVAVALGLGGHARPYSAHEVVRREVLPALAQAKRDRAVVQRVEGLHHEDAGGWCHHCGPMIEGDSEAVWPCATRRAMDGALGSTDTPPAPATAQGAVQGAGEASTSRRRLRSCVENWPNAESGAYHPSCCRFPKSCSPYPYQEAIDAGSVTESDLEGAGDGV